MYNKATGTRPVAYNFQGFKKEFIAVIWVKPSIFLLRKFLTFLDRRILFLQLAQPLFLFLLFLFQFFLAFFK